MGVSIDPSELVTLANGVRVALDPMPGLESAALGVWVGVGARDEAEAENGVAHLFEHMAFKGAGGRDAKAFAEAAENVGASLNAATGYERTAYYGRCLKEDASFVFDLVADIVRAPHWDADELAKEKDVVHQEIGEAFDQPDDRVFELHQAGLFAGQPIGRPILGTQETLVHMEVDTLARFRDAHLTAERVVIAIAGGFDRDAFLSRAEARFGDLPLGAALARPPARANAAACGEARSLEQAHLAFSWPAPPAGDGRVYAARVLSEIFGGGMSSRLFQEVREKRGLVYAVDSSLDLYNDIGRLVVYAGCAAKNAALVADLCADALLALAETGPAEDELHRAKAALRASLLMGAEAPSARVEARAAQVFLRGGLVPFQELSARVLAVTADDVRDLARLAVSGPAASAVVGPKAGLKASEAFAKRFSAT